MFYDVLDHLDPLCARGHMGLQSTDARRPLTGEVNVQKKQNAILLHTSFCIINYAATACWWTHIMTHKDGTCLALLWAEFRIHIVEGCDNFALFVDFVVFASLFWLRSCMRMSARLMFLMIFVVVSGQLTIYTNYDMFGLLALSFGQCQVQSFNKSFRSSPLRSIPGLFHDNGMFSFVVVSVYADVDVHLGCASKVWLLWLPFTSRNMSSESLRMSVVEFVEFISWLSEGSFSLSLVDSIPCFFPCLFFVTSRLSELRHLKPNWGFAVLI